MKRLSRYCSVITLSLSLLLGFSEANAMWIELTEEELVAQSDLVVTGQLIGKTRVTRWLDKVDLILGVIQIEQVLKGDTEQNVALIVLKRATGPQISTQITYQTGQKGLWFLRGRQPGEVGPYFIDHPQRFVPQGNSLAVIKAVKKILNQ